ncbi:MAG: winged helix-turn-helix transcriptional regulator, partial [Euryarchaeota archaeon]|nr:winged helix-turn-helix transcriptional regulator [Euryarchaeota archaeon]
MDELLQQGTRRRIFEAVRANPGISARELQRALHLGWGQTAYHLDQLTRGGALRRERAGGRDRYFPQEMTWEDRKILLFLRSPAERVLLVEMLASPGLTFAELPSRVGLSRSTVSFHLRHMI